MDGDRHANNAPSAAGLRRLGAAVAATAPPRTLRRLRGGVGALTHVIAFGDERVVLKRYSTGAAVLPEWDAMVFAQDHGLPAPKPLAVDPDGSWFGRPAIAMSLLPGRPMLSPDDRDRFASAVAHTLAAIHATPTDQLPPSLQRPHRIDALDLTQVPAAGHLSAATVDRITRALSPVLTSMRDEVRVYNHGDFHPGNLLWAREHLTGVVDWSSARPAARWSELAYFRVELAVLADWRTSTDLLARYESATGQRSTNQPAWDLVHVLDGHVWMHSWLSAYREQGRPDLQLALGRRRLRRLAHTLLAQLGS